jgi:amino acid transporter
MAVSETTAPAAVAAPEHLERDAIGLGRVVAYTAGFIGPAASIALGLVAAFSFAGSATPFVVLLAFLGALFATNSVAQLARKFPSAGSLYTYNARTLGRPAGFVSGWMLVFAYFIFVPAGIGAVGTFFSQFLNDAFSWHVNENVLLVIFLIGVCLLAYRGIAASATVDLVVLAIEMLIILALAVTILGKGGPGLGGLKPFDPSNTLNGKFSDITLAMVYTVVIFTGFESGAVLGEETRNPRRNVPRGILGAVTMVGLFYLFVAYSEVHGAKDMTKFAADPNQLSTLTNQYWSSSEAWIIDLAVALSTLAYVVAAFNAAVRLAYAMGREGMMPRSLGKLSRYRTPHVAIFGVGVLSLAIGLPVSISQGGFLTFAYIGGIAGLVMIVSYILVSAGVIFAFRTRFLQEFNPFTHLLLPFLAIAVFAVPLVGNFYPKPAYPFNILPYIAVGWCLLGVVVALWLRRNRPELLGRIGNVFLIEGPEPPSTSQVELPTRIDDPSTPTGVPPGAAPAGP